MQPNKDLSLQYRPSLRRQAVNAFRQDLDMKSLSPSSGKGIYHVIVVREPTGAPTPEEPPNSATTSELCKNFLQFHGNFITDIRGILREYFGMELAGIEQ